MQLGGMDEKGTHGLIANLLHLPGDSLSDAIPLKLDAGQNLCLRINVYYASQSSIFKPSMRSKCLMLCVAST